MVWFVFIFDNSGADKYNSPDAPAGKKEYIVVGTSISATEDQACRGRVWASSVF